jgi:aryl-alcohol dehydrogenase-like predicted oxidoreductase
MTISDARAEAPAASSQWGKLPQRDYGRQGVKLSIVGFGGIVVMDADPEHAARTVAQAVERGVNYFDVAPSYGNAEERLGPALQPHRKNCFLACKTGQRQAARAREELGKSLERLRTDYLDLYQLHAITDVAGDVDVAFGKGGVMEVLAEARKSGQVRHLGFSAHSVEAALAAMDRFDFDSILLPVNFATFYQGHFGPTVLARAQEKGVSVLALKALARQKRPKDTPKPRPYPKCWYEPLTDPHEQELALRFTLGQPVTAALPPGEEELFWRAVEIAVMFQPLDAAETEQLKTMASKLDPIFQV